MPGLRRRSTALALAGAFAALPVLAACTDSDAGGPEGAAPQESGAPAGGSVDTFCAEYQDLADQFGSDRSATGADMADAVATLDPPDEIAVEIDRMEAALRGSDDLDQTDPADAEQIAELQAVFTSVNEYRAAECEPDAGGAEGDDGGTTAER